MQRLPPLNALRAFEAAARHLSFQDAAAELHVTPAAVSHQVKALEEELGVALFRRLHREVQLTDAGRACLPGLRDGFARIAEAVARVHDVEKGGLITVSAAPTLAAKWLLPRIERFRAAHRGIDVRLDASLSVTDFAREDVHVALRYGTGDYPGLHSELLLETKVFPVCAPALTRGRKALKTPADLRHHPLIHEDTTFLGADFPDWPMWLKAAGVSGIDTAKGLRFGAGPLALDAAIAGKGVTLVKDVLAQDDLKAGRLVRPFADVMRVRFAYYLVCPPALLAQPKVQAFRDWIMAEAALA